MSKKLAHAIVSDYLHISKELGRPPSQEYYLQHGIYSKRNIDSAFGGWTQLIQAAGYQIPAKRLDEQEIRKQTHLHLIKEIDERKKLNIPLVSNRTLIISDMHIPVQHQDAIDFIIALNREFKPDLVCSVGDEIDLGAFSYHEKEPGLPSAGHELELAIRTLQPIYKEFPRMIIAESNHGSLIWRKAKTAGLPSRVIKSYRDVIEAPIGWEWRFEIQVQDYTGDKFIIHHSYGSNALLAAQRRGVSTITGHCHTQQSISYWQNLDKTYFAAVTGCLVDEMSLAMSYGKNNVGRPLLGCCVVENGQPKIVRMILDKFGRWVGKIFL